MIKLVESVPVKPKPDYLALYRLAYLRKAREVKTAFDAGREPGAELLGQLLFYGVRYFNLYCPIRCRTAEDTERDACLSDAFMALIGYLTPAQLITVFPVTKSYDGMRWGTKDYYFTMDQLQKIGMNTRIGEHAQELTWDYENMEIRNYVVNRLGIYSDAHKLQTGQSIGERWAEEFGIKTYTMHTDERTGRKYMLDPKMGKAVPVRRKRPRYLKVL